VSSVFQPNQRVKVDLSGLTIKGVKRVEVPQERIQPM
jgi:hypothetical protein